MLLVAWRNSPLLHQIGRLVWLGKYINNKPELLNSNTHDYMITGSRRGTVDPLPLRDTVGSPPLRDTVGPLPLRDDKGRLISGSKRGATVQKVIPNSDSKSSSESDLTPINLDTEEVDLIENHKDLGKGKVQVVFFTDSSLSMDTGPSPKRQRTISSVSSASASSRETIPLLSLMRWVHETMKQDLADAHSKSPQEFANCCNWWCETILWKKKDFTKTNKDQFCQLAFGALASQL